MHRYVGLTLLLFACPPAIRRPESAQLSVAGTLVAGGWSRRGEPLRDAKVTIRDAATGMELGSNTTSSSGGFRLAVTVGTQQRVFVVAEAAGFAPMVRAVRAAPWTELTLSAALTPLEPWECLDTRCAAPLTDLEWADPPMGAMGKATTFEAESALLVDSSPVLAIGYAELSGGDGGVLLLRIPTSAWPQLVDAMPGTGALEVNAATFEPATGKWTPLPAAPLLSEGGLALPESALSALQRVEFSGGAMARLPVTSGAFLVVMGAAPPLGCVRGTLSAEGQKAAGATLSFRGFEPAAVDEQGAFCAATPISTDKAFVRAQYAGLPYSLGALRRAEQSGTCGAGPCVELGSLELLPTALQTATLCKFTGKVIDSTGAPVPNAEVVALDESLTGATTESFCGQSGERCVRTAPSGPDGTFSLRAPLLGAMYVGARAVSSSPAGDSQRSTGQFFESCPNEPLTLKLQRGLSRLEVSASFTGTQLSWEPPRAAAHLVVTDSAGVTKWELSSPAGFTPPLTFGFAPAEAVQLVAPTGVPAAGDALLVELSGVGRDGIVYVGAGTATRN